MLQFSTLENKLFHRLPLELLLTALWKPYKMSSPNGATLQQPLLIYRQFNSIQQWFRTAHRQRKFAKRHSVIGLVYSVNRIVLKRR